MTPKERLLNWVIDELIDAFAYEDPRYAERYQERDKQTLIDLVAAIPDSPAELVRRNHELEAENARYLELLLKNSIKV